MGRHLGIDFSWILVDFGSQVGTKLGLKIGKKSIQKSNEKILKSKTILMGFGLDSDAIHSPNEHFGVSNFLNGIETITKFYHHYTK